MDCTAILYGKEELEYLCPPCLASLQHVLEVAGVKEAEY